MSGARLLLAFDGPERLLNAARALRGAGVAGMDAHTPYRLPELEPLLDLPASRVRPMMLICGLGAGLAIFLWQWWTSTQGYPINSGGRPLNSWPAFMFTVFETGVLAAALAGLVAFLAACGLPRPHHPFFVPVATEAASDDGFFLSLPARDAPDRLELERLVAPDRIIEVAP